MYDQSIVYMLLYIFVLREAIPRVMLRKYNK